MSRTRDYMTIGELVEGLQPAHPDLTISKIRFLEDEGLVTPERTAGGYRKFSSHDAARVDLVLRLHKEHFLPLARPG
jgi:DNA-binding transcriptional MerR regulator